MINVAIHGAGGRMGRTLIETTQRTDGLRVVAALERPGHELAGKDAGELAGIGNIGVPLTSDSRAASALADVFIDFTMPAATLALIDAISGSGKALVIGTTGVDGEGLKRIRAAAERMPIVMAPNMSIGVNIMFKLAELAARAMGDDVDIEVIEAHHHHKVDAPSGTAVRLGELIATALQRDYKSDAVHGRVGQVGARTKKEIGFHALRGGDIVGDHTVMYIGQGERIEITHRANSRANFAQGAMRAALWLPGKPNGLYDIQDVLGLK